MTVVNPKSISGINSITMASGSDNLLTIHANDTSEKIRINSSGDVIVGSGVTLSPDGDIFVTGISTFGKAIGDNAVGGKIILGGEGNPDAQLHVRAGSQVGVTTGVFGDTQVGIAFTDIARFDIFNKTNNGLSISMDDDSNVSYIRHRDNGGAIAFMTRSGTQNRERLRITAGGAIGIGGSNYGTSGQVIASGGSGVAPSYQYLNRPYFKAGQSTAHTLTNGDYTKVIFDDEQKDTDGAYDPSTGRFTVPSGQDGTYMFMFSVGIDDLDENDILQARVYKNGSAINDGRVLHFGGKNSIVVNCSSAFTMYGLNAGDYIEVFVYHDEGSNQETEQNRCFFEGYKLHVGDP